MRYEVEKKFRAGHDSKLLDALSDLGGKVTSPVEQLDTYFRHPVRDFAVTDEALRIRQVDARATVTYKGPKVDETTKTRAEVEFELPADQVEPAELVLQALGFTKSAVVTKRRQSVHLSYGDRRFEVALDDVATLGSFVELETIAAEADVAAARDCLNQLAEELDLYDNERASYLELILDRQHQDLPAAD